VDDMLAAGPTRTAYTFEKPMVRLVRELTRRRKYRHIYIERRDIRIDINPNG